MGRHAETGCGAVALRSVGEGRSPRGVRCGRRPYAHVVRELRARWISGRLPGWSKRLVGIGALPADSEELRIRKAVLVLSSTLMASLSCVWVVTYALLGLWASAAIPLVYQLASVASIYTFARTRRYLLFRRSQLWMSLVLPFVLQWSLGGFRNSSAVCLWGFTSPLGALLFVGARRAVSWFVAFVGLVGVSAAIDSTLAAGAPYIPSGVVISFFALNIVGVASTAYVLLQYFVREREREQARSERLLLNVLPEPVAARLKQDNGIIADAREDVTVLFADLVGFTRLSERMPASDVVAATGPRVRQLGLARRRARCREDQDDRRRLYGRRRHPVTPRGSRRGDRRDGARDGTRTRPPGDRDRTPHCKSGSASIPARSSPASSAGRSSSTTSGATRSTPPVAWNLTRCPGQSKSPSGPIERLREGYELVPRGTIEVKGKGQMTTYLLLGRREIQARADADNHTFAATTISERDPRVR